MTLLSAYEDFSVRTLAGLASAWERLRYVSSLCEKGTYRHWGMERTFGEEAAHAALAQAHHDAALALLRRPLQDLGRELTDEDCALVERVRRGAAAFSPETPSGPLAAHLSSVAAALSELRRYRASATGRAA